MDFKTKISLDRIWSLFNDKLPSPFGVGLSVLTEPLTLYVAVDGSDAGLGTPDRPFRTIQAAHDYLLDFKIDTTVVVQLGPGDYSPVVFGGLTFGPSGRLFVRGTTTVLYSGTISSKATTNLVKTTITDSGANFTVDQYKGNIMSSPVSLLGPPDKYKVVVAQPTSTTTDHGASSTVWTAGNTYEILRLDSRIATESTRCAIRMGPSNNDTVGLIGPNVTPLDVVAGNSDTAIVFETIELIGHPTAFVPAFRIEGGKAEFRGCRILHDSSTTPTMFLMQNGVLRMNGCYCESQGGGTSGSQLVYATSASSGVGSFAIRDSYVRRIGTKAGNFTVAGPMSFCGFCVFDNLSNFSFSSTGGTSVISAIWSINCTTGASIATMGSVSINGLIEGATTGISATNQGAVTFNSGSVTATTAFSVTQGSRIKIGSSVTATATNELSVDGVTGTLAAMRAASPKTFPTTPNIYSSLIFE